MKRRGFLGRAAAVVVAGGLARPSQAALACYPIHSAKNKCVAGLVKTPPIPQDPCRALSWANCLSYVLTGYGAKLDSSAILARYGDSHECLAPSKTDEDRLMAAAGIWKDAYGRRFLLQPKRLSDLSHGEMPLAEAQTLISRITRQPILCGSAGHTTLLTEFTYVDGVFSRLQIRGGTVRDPWSGSENLRPLSDEELKTPAYLIALSIRPLP